MPRSSQTHRDKEVSQLLNAVLISLEGFYDLNNLDAAALDNCMGKMGERFALYKKETEAHNAQTNGDVSKIEVPLQDRAQLGAIAKFYLDTALPDLNKEEPNYGRFIRAMHSELDAAARANRHGRNGTITGHGRG
jgi:hypothetical protein